MRAVVSGVVFAVMVCVAHSQASSQGSESFEVASFRRSADQHRQRGETGIPPPLPRSGKGDVVFHRVTLLGVVAKAYGIRPNEIEAPSWLGDAFYDIVAKVPPEKSPEQVQVMLQNLLVERLHMRTHWDQRRKRGYRLVTGKAPLQISRTIFEPGTAPRPRESYTTGNGQVQLGFRDLTMDNIAKSLTSLLSVQVENMTELEGEFTLHLDCDPESVPGLKMMSPTDDSVPGPSVMTALRKLGLDLIPATVTVRRLVVESADAIPADN